MHSGVPLLSTLFLALILVNKSSAHNSTILNPILPGFHPDPSCIFVPEWNNTFFCASSSFEAFPGIPIHASKDLQHWKHVSNVLSRVEQLPDLAITNRSTSGIWAPALRYHKGTFWMMTTLVHDERPADDDGRWDNILFSSNDPYNSSSWSDPVHFKFPGYDTSPYWDDDGTVYVTGARSWKVIPAIEQGTIDLTTGKVGPLINTWNGTGGLAPEGPHIYQKDGWYYLMAAEGGTGVNHMETMARAKNINGPYEANPANPIVSNANTSSYFQTVGHADLFQDGNGNWWGTALATRAGANYTVYPMGRETILAPVTWEEGQFPIFSHVQGEQTAWHLPSTEIVAQGEGKLVDADDNINFTPGSSIPPHFLFWRLPVQKNYVISPPRHLNKLELKPSNLNLTGYDGNYAGPAGQTFIGRRQTHTLFTYSVDMDFSPIRVDEEAGITVFLTMNHHIEFGYVLLAVNGTLAPYFRIRTLSYIPVPQPILTPVPLKWHKQTLKMEIKASNATHYAFLAGPTPSSSEIIGYGTGDTVSWGFTGTLVGIYATTNGHGEGGTSAYFSNWRYTGNGQVRGCGPASGVC